LSYIAGGIDSRRFQALFFYYPSGLRLQTLADLLYEKLDLLYERYGFHELSIVAHSMGGLIVRAYLETYARFQPRGVALKEPAWRRRAAFSDTRPAGKICPRKALLFGPSSIGSCRPASGLPCASDIKVTTCS
jgi:pimeloyl-ACP methyl ester carboxylesterase